MQTTFPKSINQHTKHPPQIDSAGNVYAVNLRRPRGRQFAGVALVALILCSVTDYYLSHWLGLPRSVPWARSTGLYRRIGSVAGPQVFCAGSSLLVYGLSWPEVSKSLGFGIETWTVGGSSPEVWEVFQQREHDPALTIIGVSVYDLNEMRLTPERASYVPMAETISDLWVSKADSALWHRVLSQYALRYMRVLFPTAGDSDKVLVGLRRKVAQALGREGTLDEHEGVVVERDGVLDPGVSATTFTEWSAARTARRLAMLRAENHGLHEFFTGPKYEALQRLLLRGQQQGRVILVVLPVSSSYTQEFLDGNEKAVFEKEIKDAMAVAPRATLVRLDQLPGISDPRYFADLVHMNSLGRRLTSEAFLTQLTQQRRDTSLNAATNASITTGKNL